MWTAAVTLGGAVYACAASAFAKPAAQRSGRNRHVPNAAKREASEDPIGNGAATGAVPFKISLAQSSLHKEFSASRLDPRDFARTASSFQIDAVEYAARFYPGKASDRSYWSELKRRAAGEGVLSLLIELDEEGLGAPAGKERKRAVDRHKRWVEIAAFLGCHAINVNASSHGSEDDQVNWLSDGVRRLCEFSDRHGIDVLLGNRGGLSSKGSWLAEVITAVGHRRAGSLPDFGRFDPTAGEQEPYQGVRELMPFARAVRAGARDFNAQGEETRVNYPQMLKVVTDAGYRSYVSIHYQGDRLSERAGIERTKALLERAREQLGARVVERR